MELESNVSLLDRLDDFQVWESYIERKKSLFPDDFRVAKFEFLMNSEECRAVAKGVIDGSYRYSDPIKKLISKTNIKKKRAVYTFKDDEMMVLRIVASLLNDYDHLFSDNLYSFRRGNGVRNAIGRLKGLKQLGNMYVYKADIHDYFNSIDVADLLEGLHRDLCDERLYTFIEGILNNPYVVFNGERITEKKGVMAGTPISPFLANYYLRDVDEFFNEQGCLYFRYADDILILSKDKDKLDEYRSMLHSKIAEKKLEMNPKKETFYNPGETFEFLGFSISESKVDVSSTSIYKIKGKIRRSSKSIRRWMLRKKAPVNGTIRALIRRYNHKFYGYEESEISWSKWFFPVITTSESLHVIDQYFQDWLRYIASGKHSKKNYELVSYETMKGCGYRPLVNEYYKSLKEKNDD